MTNSKVKINIKKTRHSIGSLKDLYSNQNSSNIVTSGNKYSINKMKSKSDSCILVNNNYNFDMKNKQNFHSFFEFTETDSNSNAEWIESGKTQLGLKIDR